MHPFCRGSNLGDPALTDDSHHIITTFSTRLPMTTLSLHLQIGQTSRSAAKYALQPAHGSPKSTAFRRGCGLDTTELKQDGQVSMSPPCPLSSFIPFGVAIQFLHRTGPQDVARRAASQGSCRVADLSEQWEPLFLKRFLRQPGAAAGKLACAQESFRAETRKTLPSCSRRSNGSMHGG